MNKVNKANARFFAEEFMSNYNGEKLRERLSKYCRVDARLSSA